jgi:hypothetical protein
MLPWIAVAAIAAWTIARRAALRHPAAVAVLIALAIASLRVQRLTVFFAIATAMLHGLVRSDAPSPEGSDGPSREVRSDEPPSIVRSDGPSGPSTTETRVVAAIALTALLITGAAIVRNLSCISASDARLADPDGARFIAANHFRGRMLTWFVWGEYAIWHFGPDLQVSMDGRRETVYTAQTITSHLDLYANRAGAAGYLAQLAPDYIWLPAQLPVIAQLPSLGWTAVYTSPASVIFARRALAAPVSLPPLGPAHLRCFPDNPAAN